jgi:putative ABC transport system substrate-binding protein
MIRRRNFITLLGGAASWPLAARGQQQTMPAVGYLDSTTLGATRDLVTAFRQGLAEVGYIEGQNLAIEYRWAEEHYDRLPNLLAELIQRQVAVIVTTGGITAALAAKASTTTIPIVFIAGDDPVEAGLVASLSRPGGNLTGVAALQKGTVAKRLELLRGLVPASAAVAVLVNPANRSHGRQVDELQDAATVLGVRLLVLNASSPIDFASAFTTLVQQRADALIVLGDPLLRVQSEQLIALSARYAVPAIYQYPADARAGGLMSYGTAFPELYRQTGVYTGRILKGEKPADLPIQQPTKFELVINLKTAKLLGLTVPTNILALADEVIE